jgi:hypothetical protein
VGYKPVPKFVAWAALYRTKILANLLASKGIIIYIFSARKRERDMDEREQWKS